MRERVCECQAVWKSECARVPVHCLQASRTPHVARTGVRHCCCSRSQSASDIPSSNKDCPGPWPMTVRPTQSFELTQGPQPPTRLGWRADASLPPASRPAHTPHMSLSSGPSCDGAWPRPGPLNSYRGYCRSLGAPSYVQGNAGFQGEILKEKNGTLYLLQIHPLLLST